MSLAATGALTSAALAAVQTGTAQSALAISSDNHDANESSFAMAESLPQYKILPVPGGLWKPVEESEATTVLGYRNSDQMLDSASMYFTASGFAVLSVFLLGFMFMGALSKVREFFGNKPDSSSEEAKPSAKFVPFVRRGDEVSPLNPLRIMGEELPGKPADTSASSRIFGRKGIQ